MLYVFTWCYYCPRSDHLFSFTINMLFLIFLNICIEQVFHLNWWETRYISDYYNLFSSFFIRNKYTYVFMNFCYFNLWWKHAAEFIPRSNSNGVSPVHNLKQGTISFSVKEYVFHSACQLTTIKQKIFILHIKIKTSLFDLMESWNKLFSFETELMDISLSDLTYIPYPNAFWTWVRVCRQKLYLHSVLYTNNIFEITDAITVAS